jgi:chromate reductase
MSNPLDVAAIVGSLRRDSYTRRLTEALGRLAGDSMPACIKNALDVGSRPRINNAFEGKPAAVISNSPGMLGGFGANHHLRQCLVAVNAPTMPMPEAYIGGINKAFDAEGALVNTSTRELCEKFVSSFEAWIRQITGK